MDDNAVRVLAGLFFNAKAIDHFTTKGYNVKIFYEYSSRTTYSHGEKEAKILAQCAVKFYDTYSELATFSYVSKYLSEVKAPPDKIAVYENVWKQVENGKDVSFGDWHEALLVLVRGYREFKNKDIIAQIAELYKLTCVGNPGSRGQACTDCKYILDCKGLEKQQTDRSVWLLDWQCNALDDVKMSTNAAEAKIHSVSDMLTSAVDEYEELRKLDPEHKIHGVPTPFPTLTHETSGWMPGRLYMVWSRSGVGKSTFLLQCANTAVAEGYSVIYFNLEMPTKDELIHRVMSYTTDTPFDLLMKKQIDDEMMAKIKAGHTAWQEKIKDAKYYIVDLPKNTKLNTIYKFIDKFKSKYGKKIFCVIDYFGLIFAPDNIKTHEWYARQAEDLHSYARDNEVPILSAGQLNRSAEGAKRISQKHTRDCDAIIDNTDGSWALVNLSKKLLRLQNIKGRYFGGEDLMLEKHLDKMGFAEYEGDSGEQINDNPEEAPF